jgi:hypothetical protein
MAFSRNASLAKGRPVDELVDPVYSPSEAQPREALLALCHDLQAAGIWLYVTGEGALTAGPPALVHRHPALLQRLRAHKAAILRLLEECLAQQIFGDAHDDPRFEQEVCPACQRACYIIQPPRRLEVHRTPDNRAVCPGSDRAQQGCTDTIMQAFVADRCEARRMAVLTWYGLRGALETWCHRRGWLLPPRPYIVAWLDTHYTRVEQSEDLPRWAGLALIIEEWLGEDAPASHGKDNKDAIIPI